MNIKELVEFHTGGAEACEAYAITPDAGAAKNKDIAKHYSKKAAWHREAVSALEAAEASLAERDALLREIANKCNVGFDMRERLLSILSTSAEPKPRGEAVAAQISWSDVEPWYLANEQRLSDIRKFEGPKGFALEVWRGAKLNGVVADGKARDV